MGKGGGGGHTPYEAPESGRSKQRIKIVEVISEGEIQGLKAGVKSVYLDKTPIQNADGSYNFRNMELQGTIGSQDQDIMQGFNTSEREIGVGTEVKKNTALTRTVTDEKVTRLRLTLGVRSLFQQKDNGDTVGASVDLLVTVGEQQYPIHFNGKYSSQYLRQMAIDHLPAVPFQIKVERLTADSKQQRVQNATVWSSYTEIIDTEFAYPNTALAGIMFDSEYFSNIPQRNYLVRGIKVKVPSNYDPIARSYSGLWDGRFKVAWTNNPAWIFYDLLTNKRYGMGQRLGDFNVDKWALYAIAQYCDVLVPDGFGGTEPRMTCNCWLTEQRQAYDLINDLASIFRAMPVWNGQQLTAIQDRPSDPVWTYTNANVVNGEFERSYSALKARHNIIHVEYLDKNDFYEKKIEYVSDDGAVKRYGANVKKVTAFGCTSRGQAYRLGRWILETEKLEKETITFSVGREGLMHLPGDIIRVADNHYAGTAIGGRVLTVKGREVTLDREIELDGASYFSYINAEAKQQTIKIQAVNGSIITLDSIPTGLTEFGVWSLATSAVRGGLYRAVSISENENGSYTITALQHEPQKEAIVDNGAHFEAVSKTLYSAPQLTDVVINTASGTGAVINAEVTAGNAIITRYDILIYQGEKLYQSYIGQKTAELKLENLPNGNYSVVIIAKDDKGRVLSEKTKTFTIDRPPIPTGVMVSGGIENILIEWDYVDEFTQTEIYFATEDDWMAAKRLVKVSDNRMYAHTVAPNSVYYYWLCHTRGQNIGPFYQEQGLRGETAEDINSTLDKLREELSENIIDEVIDTAMPARNLELVKTVSEIPAKHNGHNTLYNTADGKQYTWNGTQYTSTVPVSDITGLIPVSKLSGQLQDNQIATLSASKLTGTVAQNKIDPSFVSKVTANTSAITAETAARTKAVQDEATARTAAINTEIKNRTNAIKVESDKLTKAIQAEATTRGTAVTELQNTDKAQAESIKQVTAKADNALSGLSEERNARIAGDQAQAQARNALTTRIATAESNIATIQQSVTTQSQAISNVSQNLNAKIDNLKIGGRNLLRNTSSDWTTITVDRWGAFFAGHTVIRYTDKGFKTGDEVTVSCFLKSPQNATSQVALRFTIKRPDNTYITPVSVARVSAGEEKYLTFTIKLPDSDEFICFYPQLQRIGPTGNNARPNFDIQYKCLKLERGSIATDWTPAPEDVDANVNAVSADLTSYKSTQANIDQSQSQQIATLTSRVGNNEAQITSTQQSLTTLNQSTATKFNKINANFISTNNALNNAKTELNAKIIAEQTARANGDKANASNISALTSRMSNAESVITNIQSSKANKTEVASLAKQTLQSVWRADAKAEVDKVQVGSRNLLRATNQLKNTTFWKFYKHKDQAQTEIARTDNILTLKSVTPQKYVYYYQRSLENRLLEDVFVEGQSITYSFEVRSSSTTSGYVRTFIRQVYREGNSNKLYNAIYRHFTLKETNKWEKVTYTATVPTPKAGHSYWMFLFELNSSELGQFEVRNIKLEKGSIATDWTPAPEDVDANVNAVSAKVDTVQQTLSNAENALGKRIDTISATVGQANAQITQLSTAQATINGKLQATHTIKTEAISGGKLAIAGISLGAGADSTTAESSVIVMADKFSVVKNKSDGNPIPVFTVTGNKTVLKGDLIATGSITSDKLATNSVSAGAIQSGAIRAEHVAAGELTADKLAIGLGGNLLYNPIFANNADGWFLYQKTGIVQANSGLNINNNSSGNWQGKEYLEGENQYRWQPEMVSSTSAAGKFGGIYQDIKLVAGNWYLLSGYVAAHRGGVGVNIELRDGLAISNISRNYSGTGVGDISNASYTNGLKDTTRIWIKFKVTATGTARCIFNQFKKANVSNTFTVLRRPMLEECTQYTREPSPWQNSGVTAIHGGSIRTGTVVADKLAANSVTAEKIAAGAINASKIAANAITSNHIAAKTISADKLKVTNLSSISANLGKVTAGTITGTRIEGNTIQGGTINGTTINGTTINGGTIRGARFEGATGKFTGQLEVTELIGWGIYERFEHKIKTKRNNQKTMNIYIEPAKADRLISIRSNFRDDTVKEARLNGKAVFNKNLAKSEVVWFNGTFLGYDLNISSYLLRKNIRGHLAFTYCSRLNDETVTITIEAMITGTAKTIHT